MFLTKNFKEDNHHYFPNLTIWLGNDQENLNLRYFILLKFKNQYKLVNVFTKNI